MSRVKYNNVTLKQDRQRNELNNTVQSSRQSHWYTLSVFDCNFEQCLFNLFFIVAGTKKSSTSEARRMRKLVRSDSWHTECSNPIEVRWAYYLCSQKDGQCAFLVITNFAMVSWKVVYLGKWWTVHYMPKRMICHEAIAALSLARRARTLSFWINKYYVRSSYFWEIWARMLYLYINILYSH